VLPTTLVRSTAETARKGYHSHVASPDLDAAFRRLVDDYRTRCLWFLREDYYPTSAAEREQVLRQVEQHGDLDAFRRVAELRTWLSQRSSETSAGS